MISIDINDIGEDTATDIVGFFAEKHNEKMLDELSGDYRRRRFRAARRGSSPLAGKSIVFTGTLEGMSRPEAKARAEALGGAGFLQRLGQDRLRGDGRRCRLQGQEGQGVRRENSQRRGMAEAGAGVRAPQPRDSVLVARSSQARVAWSSSGPNSLRSLA